jgi:hypothetical protein
MPDLSNPASLKFVTDNIYLIGRTKMADTIMINGKHKQVKVYYIKPNKKAEFLDFCKNGVNIAGVQHKSVRQWLIDEGVKRVDFWICAQPGFPDSLALIAAVDYGEHGPDWSGIPHIEDYLQGAWATIEPQPDLLIDLP